ncbi:MAG: hypothetical protein AB7G11_16130 [Phycisphaerales bacterium]
MTVTAESFLRDVSRHQMTVFHEDGVYRHLRFRQSDTWNMGFDLVTWPGYLCYTGDMGCYTFARLRDMFAFFREDSPSKDGLLSISPRYWAEKCQAMDRTSGIQEYEPETFRSDIRRWIDDLAEYEDDKERVQRIREAVERDVIPHADDGEHEAYRIAAMFECEDFFFDNLHEANFREYTHHYLWCCHAIVWGIRQYDAAKATV